MTINEIAEFVLTGLKEYKIAKSYDYVGRSDTNDYIRIGLAAWELDFADLLLENIPGGEKFEDRTYDNIYDCDEIDILKEVLLSEIGKKAQDNLLLSNILEDIKVIMKFTNVYSVDILIYLTVWAATRLTSAGLIYRFYNEQIRKYERDMKTLDEVHEVFKDYFWINTNKISLHDDLIVLENKIYEYVKSLRLIGIRTFDIQNV